MIQFCSGCNKKHEDFNWKHTSYELEHGRKDGWFCREWFKPTTTDHTPERIKQQRITNAGDIVQPRREGKASKEFIDRYPNQAKKMFSNKEIKGAKRVWKDLKGL